MSDDYETEEIDVEEEGRKGGKEPLPKARKYVIRVDKPKFTVTVPQMKGREILTLAGKTPPEQWKLTQKFHGGQAKTIGLDEDVDFRAPGVERFMTLKRDQTEGDRTDTVQLRRAFTLPSHDVSFLNSTGLDWEAIIFNGSKWVLIHRWPMPQGYTAPTATIGLPIAAGYPEAQIDMAYFDPSLTRTDGRAIGALSPIDLDGRKFQQWSRHRTGASPWRSGEDDISTHLVLVIDWLEREFTKP